MYKAIWAVWPQKEKKNAEEVRAAAPPLPKRGLFKPKYGDICINKVA